MKYNKINIVNKFPQFFNENSNVYVGKGWYKILFKMFQELEALLKEHPDNGFKIIQIKEKFGSLRIYFSTDKNTDKNTELISNIIRKYEDLSANICEICGLPAKIRTDVGWIRSLCWFHYNLEKLSRKYLKIHFGLVKHDIQNTLLKIKQEIFK